MFDRYIGMKKQLSPLDKAYLSTTSPDDLILPSLNVQSFLSAQNTESAPQRVVGRGWKQIAKAALTFVDINPFEIPILKGDRPATKADLIIDYRKAIIKKGALAIPSDKERPVLPLPWSMAFTLTLYDNPDLDEYTLRRLFEDGGVQIGFGTYRGAFGKFEVTKWE